MLLRRYFTVHQCIPLDETIQICLDKLYSLPDPPMYNFKDNVRVCYLKKSHISFDGKYYEQTDGVAMGAPVGPVLANIFMRYFEQKWVMTGNARPPSIWFRYVDNSFTMCDNE